MHEEIISKLCPNCKCETTEVLDSEGNVVCICTKCHIDDKGTILEVCDCCYEYGIQCTCVKCENCHEPFLFCECNSNNNNAKVRKIKKKPPHKIEIDMGLEGQIKYPDTGKTEIINMDLQGDIDYTPPEENDTSLILV